MMRTMVTTRLIAARDAAPLTDLVVRNRDFLAPWEPIRPAEYFTLDGQRRIIEDALMRYRHETMAPHVIVEDGVVVGHGPVDIPDLERYIVQFGGFFAKLCTVLESIRREEQGGSPS